MTVQLPHPILQFGAERGDRRMRLGSLLRSNRFVLTGTFTFCILIPELFHPVVVPGRTLAQSISPGEPILLVAIVALLIVHFILRRVGILPLIDDKVVILPTFVTTFALVAFGLTLAIRTYGHYHMVTAFGAGLVWYFVVALGRVRNGCPRLAFLGDLPGDTELLSLRIEWVMLRYPRLPRNIQGIVFDSSKDLEPSWERLFARAVLRNIPVYDLAQIREMTIGRVRLRERPELVFGQLLPSQPYLRIKRLIDTFAVIPGLFFAAPLITLAALAIRLESPGPVFFVQRRTGYQGRVFCCYKLRSMRTDMPGTAYTLENDPRITRVGQFIRKWRIDELPQLFNILKGEMSFIGPRPEAVSLSRSYQRSIPYYQYRHAVRPGISGWAAVHQGNVALTEAVTEKLEYDFYYIKYFSFWLDAVIVLMTIRTIVTGFGSR